MPARSYGEALSVVVRALLVPGSSSKTTRATPLAAGTKTYEVADRVAPSRGFAAVRVGLPDTMMVAWTRAEAAVPCMVVVTTPAPTAATTAMEMTRDLLRNRLRLGCDGAR